MSQQLPTQVDVANKNSSSSWRSTLVVCAHIKVEQIFFLTHERESTTITLLPPNATTLTKIAPAEARDRGRNERLPYGRLVSLTTLIIVHLDLLHQTRV